MSLQALQVTNTAINIQPAGNSLQAGGSIGGRSTVGGNVQQWAGPSSQAVSCPIASPAVFTGGCPIPNGTTMVLSGTTIPTGFTAGTIYFVVNTSGNTFQLSATSGGSAINASGAGVGLIASGLIPTVVADVTAAANVPFESGEIVVVFNPTNASLVLQGSDDQVTWYTLATVPAFSFKEANLSRQYIRVSTAATLSVLAN